MSTVTVAICARRAERIIGACLDSIRHQTIAPDEILVAIDESSDPTGAVAESYGARVVVSNATGLYEARNAVLDACRTDYLFFTDADCELAPEWVECAKSVLDAHPDIAAGTGPHPPVGRRNAASWLHHMWYVVETLKTGDTNGVIGGNSYFRTGALREAGGWLKLPRHSAAEDLYISIKLVKAGHRIWFDERAAARHNYETRLGGLWRKSVMMGRDIVVMLRAAGWYERLWWYTLAIPLTALCFICGLVVLLCGAETAGAALMALPLAGSFFFFLSRFRTLGATFPRWVARWLLIWPYSWGVIQGLFRPIPPEARQ